MAKKAKRKRSGTKPEMRAFLACDVVSQDAQPGLSDRGKNSLHGIFDIILIDEFPAVFRPFFVYLRLAPGNGRADLSIQGMNVDGKPLIIGEVPVKLNPKGHTDVVCRIAQLPLKSRGIVTFVAMCDGTTIGWPCEVRIETRDRLK